MPSLLVLHPRRLTGENHGVVVQHVTTLAMLLERRGWTVVTTDLLDPDLARVVLAADLVLVQMLANPEVEAIVRARRAAGRSTIFEITDNFLGLGDWAAATHPLHSPLTRGRLLYHAWLCDALQVYSPGLVELFGDVNPRIVRLDPYVPIPSRRPLRPAGFVIGWGGTQTHAADIAAISPALAAFCGRHPAVRFAYMGDRDVFDRHFGGIDGAQTSVRPFGTHEEYVDFVAGLDIGLGPLRPTPFNAARTDTRFGVYAACGVAAVLEDGPAYAAHDSRARLFRTPAELEAILEDLHTQPDEVESLGARAHAWAQRERSADVLAAQRDGAYRDFLPAEPSEPASLPPRPPEAISDRLAAAAGLEPVDALTACGEIVADYPDYEQARLLAAHSLERLGRDEAALAYIENLTPSQVYADLFVAIQVRCSRRARPEDADRFLGRVSSPLAFAHLRAHASVLERSRAVLRHQPYDHFALRSSLLLLERADPTSTELNVLYARACLVAPEDVPPCRRPAHLARFLPT